MVTRRTPNVRSGEIGAGAGRREEASISTPCPRCGRATAFDDRFCGGCGAGLTAACGHCGRRLTAALAFCTGCGRVRTDPGSGPPTKLEDRRRVSVLFVDLVDFTPYVERSDPEQVRGLQTRFFSATRRVIGRYGGVVEKFIGDAVMALFGAPVATETDVLCCVHAALELQQALAGGGDPRDGAQLRARIGIATGEALVDVAAAYDGGQAIVAGDVVTTASRLQSAATAGGVLVCGATYELTRGAVRFTGPAPMVLRGHSAPTQVWQPVATTGRPAVRRQPDTAPLLDRDHELELLVNTLHRSVRDRVPQLVTVLGRAGIGKSRLVRELVRRGDRLAAPLPGPRPRQRPDRLAQPVTWRWGRCLPFGENVAFAPVADIVRAETGILDSDPAAVVARRLDAAADRLVDAGLPILEARRIADALRPLLGLPAAPLAAEDAEAAWRRFLLTMAARRPTVLVVEDLHCADEVLLRFVDLLGASARDVPLLVIGTARPEPTGRRPGRPGGLSGSMTITLGPLRDTAVAALYAHLFGRAAFPAETLNTLVEAAGGNPLYAHEYARMLLADPAARRCGWDPALRPGEGLPLPDGVQAVIANRVDLLDPADRMVLLAAAVVGVRFWAGAVAAALRWPVAAVEPALRRLAQQDLVVEGTGTPAGNPHGYRFCHPPVREVCYHRLPRAERMHRHQGAADWLQARAAGGRNPELVEALAQQRWSAYQIARELGLHPPGAGAWQPPGGRDQRAAPREPAARTARALPGPATRPAGGRPPVLTPAGPGWPPTLAC